MIFWVIYAGLAPLIVARARMRGQGAHVGVDRQGYFIIRQLPLTASGFALALIS
jgi:hypothetical protein